MLKRFSKQSWAVLIIILIGVIFRLYHLFIVPMDQPFRLGGLFYEFSRQISHHNFAFPQEIPYYSLGGIPFAYPPLSFYAQALLIRWLHPPLFWTVNLLPPLITLLTLPAFYWMIKQFTDDSHLLLAGLFTFALMPQAFIFQVEAAGLAEAFGLLALLLYLGMIFRWKVTPTLRNTVLAGLALGGCVLSSPGSAYAAALLSVLLFIWLSIKSLKARAFKAIGLLILVGVIGMIVSAPYWLTVMRNHGINFFVSPFLGQHQTSESSFQQITSILSFQPAGIYLGFIWNWLILAGLFWAALNRQFLALAIFWTFWLIPREGTWLVATPAAILAGMGIVYILTPLLKKVFQRGTQGRPPLAPGILVTLLVVGVFANTLITIHAFIADEDWYIDSNQITSLEKFQNAIPDGSGVIVIGNTALAEWAPALIQREVLNIEYGLEWQPDELQKVQAINAALEEVNWALVIPAIEEYAQDQLIYLVATPEGFAALQGTLPPSASLSLIDTTPGLLLYTLEIFHQD